MAIWSPGEILDTSGSIGSVVSIIRKAVADGLGANATEKFLRSMGMGRRRENVLSVHKAFTYAYEDPGVYLPLYSNQKPRSELIPMGIYQQSRTYLTTVWYDTIDPVTDQSTRRYISVTHSVLDSVDNLIDTAIQNAYRNDSDVAEIDDAGIESILYSENPIYG